MGVAATHRCNHLVAWSLNEGQEHEEGDHRYILRGGGGGDTSRRWLVCVCACLQVGRQAGGRVRVCMRVCVVCVCGVCMLVCVSVEGGRMQYNTDVTYKMPGVPLSPAQTGRMPRLGYTPHTKP